MKRVGNLYNIINDIDIIMDMYDRVISKNTKNKRKLMSFDDYYSSNIGNIKRIINYNNYIPDKYSIFLIKEPKYRIIMSQSIKDKIINHLVAKYFLVDIFEKSLINENVATRKNKGAHYGLKLFKKYLNYYKNRYKKFYILKFDISKYFYNIDYDIVKDIIKKKIKDKDVLKIIYSIIDSTDCDYINKSINRLKELEIKRVKEKNINKKEKLKLINEIENIPLYKKKKGFPIGNMAGQIVAISYLNELDHFIKDDLKIKSYVRYMDDVVLIHNDKEYLKYCLKEIEKIIHKYRLELNKKTRIYSSLDKIEFLGFRFIINNKIIVKVSNKTKKNFKKRMKILYKKYNNRLISYNDLICFKDSYLGHLKYSDCKNLLIDTINRYNKYQKSK